MATRISRPAKRELTEVLANLNAALATLDRLKAPQYIGARLDQVIGEVGELLGSNGRASEPRVLELPHIEAARPAA